MLRVFCGVVVVWCGVVPARGELAIRGKCRFLVCCRVLPRENSRSVRRRQVLARALAATGRIYLSDVFLVYR